MDGIQCFLTHPGQHFQDLFLKHVLNYILKLSFYLDIEVFLQKKYKYKRRPINISRNLKKTRTMQVELPLKLSHIQEQVVFEQLKEATIALDLEQTLQHTDCCEEQVFQQGTFN